MLNHIRCGLKNRIWVDSSCRYNYINSSKVNNNKYLICLPTEYELKLEEMLLFSHSVMSNSLQPHDCHTPGFPVLHHLLELAQTHVHWVSDAIQHLILCCPLLLLTSVFPNIRVFSNESTLCIRWSKYWSFSFSIIPSNEYSGLISFRIYCLISLQAKGLSRVFFNTTIWKYPIEYELKLEQVVIC